MEQEFNWLEDWSSSVDLSKAFGPVRRTALLEALRRMGVSEPHIEQVRKLHETDSILHVIATGCRRNPTWQRHQTGLQASPVAVGSADYCRQEALHELTIFADNNLFHLSFLGPQGFQTAIQECTYLLDILSDLGLTVNPEKSLWFFGSQNSPHSNGHKARGLILLSPDRMTPIKSEITYLVKGSLPAAAGEKGQVLQGQIR